MIRAPSSGRGDRSLEVNMTSMVDIVFLLIIFFMLVSSFISAENIKVDLPQPDRSIAQVVELPERVVLNCRFVPGGGVAGGDVIYQIGVSSIQTLDALEGHLRGLSVDREDLQLVLRADRRIRYAQMRGVLQTVARAGIQDVHMAAEVED